MSEEIDMTVYQCQMASCGYMYMPAKGAHPFSARGTGFVFRALHPCGELFICNARDT